MPARISTLPDPVPLYDLAVMPPEERIMALIDYWLRGDLDAALQRFSAYGLPAVAMQDMIVEHDYAFRRHFALPENRACNKPRHRWNIVAVVLARGGSKGLPGKALRTVGGVPLIVQAIRKCQAIRDVKRILVNTDSLEIAATARQAGAETPFLRPAELATDTASSTHAALFGRFWLSMIEDDFFDFHVVVSATHPLFDPDELNRALDAMAAEEASTLQTVAALPTFNREFYTLAGDTLTTLSLPMISPGQAVYSQCGAFSITGHGPYYHLCGVYLARERARVPRRTAMAWVLPVDQGVDIDHPRDLALAERVWDESGGGASSDGRHRPTPARRTGGRPSPRPEDAPASCGASLPYVRVLWIPSPKEPPVWDGVPVPFRVLRTLASLGQGPLFVAGPGGASEAMARAEGLLWLDMAGAAFPCREMFGRLRQDLARHGAHGPVLVVDARAAALTHGGLCAFVAFAMRRQDTPACSVSRPPVHPAHLRWIGQDGPAPVCDMNGARRQDLPPVWCRDGVLTWLPAEGEVAAFSHGMELPEPEALLVDTAFDRMRLTARLAHPA